MNQNNLFSKRPFEFRGWHIPSKRLFVVRCFYGNRVWEEATELRPVPDVYLIDDCILLQYTGLTDERGTKIFEGDVLYSHQEHPDNPDDSEEFYLKVVHWCGSFGMALLDGTGFQRFSNDAYDKLHRDGYDAVSDPILVASDLVAGNVFELDQLPPLVKYPTRPAPPPPDADPNPDAVLIDVSLDKHAIADAHKAMLRWEEGLVEIAQDVTRLRNPYAYQVHFSWLGTLQGLDAGGKNDLFVKLRDQAKANGIDWDRASRKFYIDQRKEVLAT